MKALWQQRFINHVKEQRKFLKLVFNEYFIIALIFMLGAVGFWYSKALTTLPQGVWWAQPVAIIIIGLVTLLFHPVTLLQAADEAFLLPQERSLPEYLRGAHSYSLLMPIISLMLLGFFLTPFLARGVGFSLLQVILLVIIAIIIVITLISNQLTAFYQSSPHHYLLGENIILNFGILIIAVYLNTWLALVLAVLWWSWCEYRWHRCLKKGVFQWHAAIIKEANRSYQLKRFYNLFTDVPGISSKVARRKWLDWLFRPITLEQKNTYFYLFARGFVRNSEYSGLFVRLTIVALLLIYAIHNYWVLTVIGALFIYLVEFQLLPLFKKYDAIVLTHIYPLTESQKQQSFQLLVTIVLLLQWLIMTLALLIFLGLHLTTFLPIIISLVMVIVLVKLYLPRQLQKLKQ